MAERPWRCSQCGTTNEPVANSCRTCGKWPSLFDLEDNSVEDEPYEVAERVPVDVYEPPEPIQTADAPEPLTVEVEPFEEPDPPARRRRFEPPPTKPVLEGEADGRRNWVSWLVPVAVVVYLLISYAFSGR